MVFILKHWDQTSCFCHYFTLKIIYCICYIVLLFESTLLFWTCTTVKFQISIWTLIVVINNMVHHHTHKEKITKWHYSKLCRTNVNRPNNEINIQHAHLVKTNFFYYFRKTIKKWLLLMYIRFAVWRWVEEQGTFQRHLKFSQGTTLLFWSPKGGRMQRSGCSVCQLL